MFWGLQLYHGFLSETVTVDRDRVPCGIVLVM